MLGLKAYRQQRLTAEMSIRRQLSHLKLAKLVSKEPGMEKLRLNFRNASFMYALSCALAF